MEGTVCVKTEGNTNQSDSVLKKRKCVIEDVILKNKAKAEPLLVTFANGRPQENAGLSGTLHQNISKDHRRQNRRIFTIETPRLNYVGANFGNDMRTPANHTMFIGILDKTTGKMRLVETSSYCARPMLKRIDAANPLLNKAVHSLTYAEKQEIMTSAFGTKKAKQLVSRKKQYQVDVQNMSVAVDQAVATVSLRSDELIADSQEEESLLSILPKCNREASSPAEVYRLDSIAPDTLLVYFEDYARHLLLEGIDTDQDRSTILFRELFASAKLEEDEENQVRLACVALYVEYLLMFLKIHGKDLRYMRYKDDSLQGCPPKIKNHIMNEFTQLNHKQRFRSLQNEDSAICCALVLALITNKFKLSVDMLLQSLNIPSNKLSLLMKVIGATYMTQSKSYVLKIPLAKIAKQFKRARPRTKR